MIDRQLRHSRMTTQTRRREPPSALTRQPALPAAECGPRLGLNRPRKHPNHRSINLADPPPFASLEGRTALVTGASKGIGRAIAEELARAGATVVVGYRSGQEEAEALAGDIGGRAVQADVSSPEEAKRLVADAGDLDVLVNNAGLTRDTVLARMSDDDWRTVLETNLSSV